MIKNTMSKILGKAILLASLQSVFASIELSNKISIVLVTKDQETLQKVADSVTMYIIFAFFWALGTCMLLYSSYGLCGFFIGLITNLIVVSLLVYSYLSSIKKLSKKYNLEFPKLFELI